MLAAVFEGNGQLVLKDRPKPVLQNDNDALIKVTGVGICGTDLHILAGIDLLRQGNAIKVILQPEDASVE